MWEGGWAFDSSLGNARLLILALRSLRLDDDS